MVRFSYPTHFVRSKHNSIPTFSFSQDYYELQKRTIVAKGNICHIIKPINCRDVQNIYQDKLNYHMTFNEFELITSSC